MTNFLKKIKIHIHLAHLIVRKRFDDLDHEELDELNLWGEASDENIDLLDSIDSLSCMEIDESYSEVDVDEQWDQFCKKM